MIINKILYFFLVVVSAIFYLLYIDNLSVLLLIFVLALPVFMCAVLLVFKLTVKLSVEPKNNYTVKKEKFILSAVIDNKTIFPFPNCVLVIEYGNKSNKTRDQITINVPIYARSRERIEIGLSSDYCGIAEARFKSLKVYDYLKLFSCKIKLKNSAQIYVMPEIYEIKNGCSLKSTDADESDIYSKYKSGDDPAEVFDLKEYAQGDKINRIHWNLSLRQDKIITRHYSQPISSSVLVAVEYLKPEKSSGLETIDSVTETAASVSAFLSDNEVVHNYVFYNRYTMSFERYSVSGTEDLSEILSKMYRAGSYSGDIRIPDYISEVCDEYSKIIYITPEFDTNKIELCNKNSEKRLSVILVSDNENKYRNVENPFFFVVQAGKISESIRKIII